MTNEIIIAIFTFLGAFVGGAMGSIGTAFTLRYNYRELYAKTISESRNRWIDILRERVSVMIAEAEIIMSCSPCPNVPVNKNQNCDLTEHYSRYYQAKNEIIMRINEKENKHLQLYSVLTKFDSAVQSGNYEQFIREKENLLLGIRYILKGEWERVKGEARGRQ